MVKVLSFYRSIVLYQECTLNNLLTTVYTRHRGVTIRPHNEYG